MSDFARALIGLFAVIAAPGAIQAFAAFAPVETAGRSRLLAAILGPMLGLLVIAALLSDPVLDGLSVSPESFQLAAGLVMLPLAARLIWSGTREAPATATPVWRGWSLLFGPAPVVAALGYAARFDEATAIGAAAVAIAASACLLMAGGWIAARLGVAGGAMLGRLTGGLVVLLAIELIVDGVQSV